MRRRDLRTGGYVPPRSPDPDGGDYVMTPREVDEAFGVGQSSAEAAEALTKLNAAMQESTAHREEISHPNHYTWHPSGVECRTIVQEFDYNIGNAMAYLWRWREKDGIKDLRKAIQHIEFEIDREQRRLDRELGQDSGKIDTSALSRYR